MRKRITLCTLALSVIFLITGSAVAVNDQGLSWGVEIGDRHEYSFRYEDVTHQEYSFFHEFYLVVESLPIIPDNITHASPLSFGAFPGLEYYHLNGSNVDDWYWHLPPLIIPTRNWTLWTELFEDLRQTPEGIIVSIEIEEGLSTWSYRYNQTIEDHTELGEASYVKETGILTDFLWSAYLEENKYVEYEVHLLGQGIAPEIVIIAIGGAAIVVIVIILLVRKKG